MRERRFIGVYLAKDHDQYINLDNVTSVHVWFEGDKRKVEINYVHGSVSTVLTDVAAKQFMNGLDIIRRMGDA